MAVSIAHRVMGVGLATVGTTVFVWWLAALASGKEAYAAFLDFVGHPAFLVVPVGLTFAFWLHMANGIRHFVMDIGAGYELKTSRLSALAVFAFAFIATGIFWLIVFARMI